MDKKHELSPNEDGFTLVELSIVLVIIGLIVGGVLVGQDMIRAAEIRSTVAQIESYNTAANTFRDKYRNIPGDILSNDAARFGLNVRSGSGGQGDGDKLLEGCTDGATIFGCETQLFWRDLAAVDLLGTNISAPTTDNTAESAAGAVVSNFMPEADIGQGHYITTFSVSGRNFYQIAQVNSTSTGAYSLGLGMSPQVAFNIDDKLDDGDPFNGRILAAFGDTALNGVIATPAAVTTNSPASAATDCAGELAGENTYNTGTEATANEPACQLRVRAGF